MANPRRALTVFPSIAVMQSSRGPLLPDYGMPLDRPRPFRFAPGSSLADDGWTALETSGGTDGRYLDMPEDDLGSDLADGNATITVGGKRRRILAVGTLTQNSTGTLSATNARAGHVLELSLQDTGAFTYAIINGGPGGGTIATKASGQALMVVAYFNGTNWRRFDSHAIT